MFLLLLWVRTPTVVKGELGFMTRKRDFSICFLIGDRKYKVPALNPLEISELVTRESGMTLTLRHLKVYGLLEANIKNVK